MPLYEYKCHACGKTFEVIQKFSDEPLKTHPVCGGEVEKLFSAPAFHLKGTGWYATDYAKKGGSGSDHKTESKTASGADGGEKSASTSGDGSSSSSTTESKPATSDPKPAATPASAASTEK